MLQTNAGVSIDIVYTYFPCHFICLKSISLWIKVFQGPVHASCHHYLSITPFLALLSSSPPYHPLSITSFLSTICITPPPFYSLHFYQPFLLPHFDHSLSTIPFYHPIYTTLSTILFVSLPFNHYLSITPFTSPYL